MEKASYYKIKHISSGLYSNGGTSPSFKPQGKIWTLGSLRLHLRLCQKINKLHFYKDCELVILKEYRDDNCITLVDLIKPLEEEIVIRKLQGKI